MIDTQILARNVDPKIQRRFKAILADRGLSISETIRAFLKKVVETDGDFLNEVIETKDLK